MAELEELQELARYASHPALTSLTEIAKHVAVMTGQQLHADPWDDELWRRKNQVIGLLVARIEELEKVVELGKALLFQSELKEDKAAYEEWYEVAVPEWEDLRDALAALGARP